jgi:Tfp pilus assembly protein PilF
MRIRFAWLCLFLAAPSLALAESTPHWLQVRSDHFIVISDSTDKQARHVAAEFERMRSVFVTLLPRVGNDTSPPIVVLALKDKKGFDSLEPAAYLAKGALRLDGLFLRTPGTNYILVELDAQQEHPFATVYHEYTHYIMRKLEWMPIWLGEGLAEFYQNTDIHDKDVLLGQASRDDIFYLRQNKLLPLTTLFAVDHNSPYYHDEQKGSVFYAESWALVHYIEINDFKNKTSRLNAYAQNLARQEDPVTAAQHAFGDLSKLQKELDSYVSQDSFSAFTIKRSFDMDEASLHSTPISLDDANATRAGVLAFDDRQPEAKSLAEAVLRDDPKNVLALEALGAICTSQRDSSCAKKWYSQAAQLDSHNAFALYSYAALSMQDGGRGEDATIEASLKQSIQIDPTFAPAYDALAHFYSMHNEKLDEAHMANVRAIQLEPEQLAYRLNAASVLMTARNYDGALAVLRAAQPSFRSSNDAAVLAARIQQLEQYQAEMKSHPNFTYTQNDSNSPSTTATGTTDDGPAHTITIVEEAPADSQPPYPPTPASGAHHTAAGILHGVKCSYPTLFTLDLIQPKQTLALYSNNYMKLPFTTNYVVSKGTIDVCKNIEGMKARIEYADVSDPRVKGQIVSIELTR